MSQASNKAAKAKSNLKESPAEKQKRIQRVLKKLQTTYKDAHCALNFETPFELLVATILSAQCTDERVNKVTPDLFERFPDPQAMAKAEIADVEILVRSTGFYKNKAKNIVNAARDIVMKHGGEIPKTLHELSALPGVGRKTANVVLGNAFGIPGLVVDTHVTRLANRLDMAKGVDAVKLEQDLGKIVPLKHWVQFSHWLISHGRAVCSARKPDCESCVLFKDCPRRGI
ncbi:MAG: endonuclease III [Bdellovibrionales bacterium]|nr:endonuclease III [Bdellovibrionales bacterium]